MKDIYPEIESSCVIQRVVNSGQGALLWERTGFKVSVEGVVYPKVVFPKKITSDALDIFDFEWIEGDKNVMAYGNNEIAISEELANKVCGNNSPLGKKMILHDREIEFEIVGVYKTRSMHSNLKFEIIMPLLQLNDGWNTLSGHTYILLKSGVNGKRFIQKLQTDTIGRTDIPAHCIATPLPLCVTSVLTKK